MEPILAFLYWDVNDIEEDYKITTSMLRTDYTLEHEVQATDRNGIYNVNRIEDVEEDIEDIVERNCNYLGGNI